MDTRNDHELVEASRRGEHAAFGELVERHQRAVLAVSYSRTRDRALGADIAQDTFVIAWRELDRLRDTTRIKPWLCGIARNLARRSRRRRDREVPVGDIPSDGTPFDHVDERQAEAAVAAALERVDDKYREALVLYYYEQRSIGEVAAALGISEHAAYQRLSRGRQRLAGRMTELVEHTLERRKSRRDLVAAVLAAIAIAPSHAEAATKEGTRMKTIGIAVSVVMAVGTGGYFLQQSLADGSPDATYPAAPSAAEARTEKPAAPPARNRIPVVAPSSSPAHDKPRVLPAARAPASCEAAGQRYARLMLQDDADPCGPHAQQDPDLPVAIHQAACDKRARFEQTTAANETKKCRDDHWSEDVVDCFATARDRDDLRSCGYRLRLPPPRPTPVSADVDASCAAIGRHVQAMAQSLPSMYQGAPAATPQRRELGRKLAEQVISDKAAKAEKICTDEGWPDEVRRCYLGATTAEQADVCR